jgi:ribulose-5-phosphate 4-epimerase/fuculose-1-phosphate aldolase
VASVTSLTGHGPDAVSEAERRTRRDLAAFYRLVDHHGWTDLIYNHISANIPGEPDAYLVNPYGLLYGEITPENLVKVALADGAILSDDPAAQTNLAAHDLHAPVLAARDDLQCLAHIHTPAIMAVSAMASGLLPLTQTAMGFYGRLGYHDYGFGGDACARLVRDFEGVDTVILRNHGVMIAGRTIAEAYVQLHNFQMACEAQVLLMAAGSDIAPPPQAIVDGMAQGFDGWLNRPGGPRDPGGCVEWHAVLRMLARKGVDFAKARS